MRQWTIDAFASAPFMGNPACVVEPFDDWPDTAWMQALAGENNQAETAFLFLIEMKTFQQIAFSLVEYLDPHAIFLESRFRAASQLLNRALPCSTNRSRSSRIDFCHDGTGTSASRRHRSSHNVSIACNFSAKVNCSMSIEASTDSAYHGLNRLKILIFWDQE